MSVRSFIACMLFATPFYMVDAATPDGRLFQPGQAWLERYDSTLISSRYFGEFIYESHDDESELFKLENTTRWGIPLRDDHAIGFQFMLPLKWRDTADGEAFGLGDLELRSGFVGRLSPTLRYGLGLNAQLDTATDSNLEPPESGGSKMNTHGHWAPKFLWYRKASNTS